MTDVNERRMPSCDLQNMSINNLINYIAMLEEV